MPSIHPARPQIVTNNLPIAGPGPSSKSHFLLSPDSAQSMGRQRSASSASDASTLSIVSPAPSSASSSSLSVNGHEVESPADETPKQSLDLEETMGPVTDYVLAMHDYTPQHQSATCLSFKAGQVIHVINRDASGWWDGELEGRRGWFPSNYVNSNPEEEDEDLTEVRRPTHQASHSESSATSWSSNSATPRRAQRPPASPADADHCPPIMVPLLHGLSLLQNAVRNNRFQHFQPSTACIISCVRSILNSTHTLQRDAPILHQFPPLAHERRAILAVLANLVAQAKLASEGSTKIDQGLELEVDAMLRLGGQVFAHMRRFLAVAVQCGIELPEKRQALGSMTGDTDWATGSDLYDGRLMSKPAPMYQYDGPAMSPIRAKSMGELRNTRSATHDPMPTMPKRFEGAETIAQNTAMKGHRPNVSSISSSTSSSSFSSLDSMFAPPRPPLPSGPCTAPQVAEALRQTHDHYLSTIAAFIGHVHSYSRTSHASSTGHMYELVREVVEVVCKMLTIVEAVLTHPDLPSSRLTNLRGSKEGLYRVTSSLAESVRLLTIPLPYSVTEEDERQALLKSATDALKIGADCVSAVRMCLNWSPSWRPFILQTFTLDPRAFDQNGYRLRRSTSSDGIRRSHSEEDVTMRAQEHTIRIDEYSGSESSSGVSKSSSMGSQGTGLTSPDEIKNMSPLLITHGPVEPDLPSPSSFAHTEDGTTWEGSIHTTRTVKSLEAKMIHGDLPVLPHEPLEPIPEMVDPMAWLLSHEYAMDDVAYNKDGHLVGATLEVLVEKLTPHDNLPDPAFLSVFFLTFRIFSKPTELAETLIKRWNLPPPAARSEDDVILWQERKLLPVRMRVSNFVKTWVEMYWRSEVDECAVEPLSLFVDVDLRAIFPSPAQRIMDLFKIRSISKDYAISPKGDRTRDPGMSINPPTIMASEIPRPSMTKNLLTCLRAKNYSSIAITDFDPLELARQLTIMECNLYCAIQPEEILESGREGAKLPMNVKAVTTLSTVITGWVMESILNEPDTKKRATLIKFFIKVADRCSSLNNYSTPRSMLAALDSSTISRLRQTWLGLPQKNKLQLETMRRLADHGRNYHEYRAKLRNTAPPAVPFLGLYLTDVTFCREGNPSHRVSPTNPRKKLLNFNKYHKLARIVQDMQRFQVPYTLKAIPEVQIYLNYTFQNSEHHGDLQDLYRRSLLVEPKRPADNPPVSDMRHIFNWATKSQIPAKTVTPLPMIIHS